MEEEFANYQQAVGIKDLGFDEPCMKEFHNKELKDNSLGEESTNSELSEIYGDSVVIAALTKRQAFKWFREKYGLHSHVRESYSFDNTLEFVSQINGIYVNHGIFDKPVNRFETHEEAENVCIDKLIELGKKLNNEK